MRSREVTRQAETRDERHALLRKLRFIGEAFFNAYGTHIPIHSLRLAWLRCLGAQLGPSTTVFRGTTVLGAENLRIGHHCTVGWRCVLDARGSLTFGDNVNMSSDSQIITADHDLSSPGFEARHAPVVIGSYVWLATRSMVLKGVTVGYAGVVAAGGVAVRDVPERTVVGGIPARPLGPRSAEPAYDASFRLPFW